MGNRAVITSTDKHLGIYVHWNGGPESVLAFLQASKELKHRGLIDDPAYGFARLCQVVTTFFEGECSVGIGTLDQLDCDNYDNGTYVVDNNWNIVERYGKGSEPDLPSPDSLSDNDKAKFQAIKDLIVKRIKSSEAITN